MIYIVGLGNPGAKYQNTRHNAGHMLIDHITSSKIKAPSSKLFKTDCYMNTSGKFIKKLFNSNRQLKAENLYIAHDDLDISLGKFKISFGRGPKVHNGIGSIEDALGTNEFWRIRIGVDNRKSEGEKDGFEDENSLSKSKNSQQANKLTGEQYVLSLFDQHEVTLLRDSFGAIEQRLSQLQS